MDGTTFSNNELVSSNFPDGEWIHVTIKWDGTKQYIYKNGVLDIERTFVGTPTHQVVEQFALDLDKLMLLMLTMETSLSLIVGRSLTAHRFSKTTTLPSKYLNEAPDTARITDKSIVIDNLLLNYDFGNRATYDRVENAIPRRRI